MFVDVSANRVGIGTTSPARELSIGDGTDSPNIQLLASSLGNSRIEFGDTDDSDAGEIQYVHSDNHMQFTTNGTERVRIDASGNVGIGTTSPSADLHIYKQTDAKIIIEGDTDNDGGEESALLQFKTDGGIVAHTMGIEQGTANALVIDAGNGSNTTVSNYLVFKTKPVGTTTTSERMRIDSSGNVGIGTNSPDAFLTLNKDVSTAYDSSSDNAQRSNTNTLLLKNEDGTANSFAQIAFDLGASDQPIARIAGINTGLSSSALSFVVEGGNVKKEAMRIDSTGNVLVGTTDNTPYNNATGSGICWGGGANRPNSIARESTATCLILNKTGTQAGSTQIQEFRYDGVGIGNVSISSTAVAFNTGSDYRLKENITDSADAGSKIDAIQIRQFDWKSDGSHQDYGVIAQELVTVAPEAVHQPVDEEDMMGVDYSKLVPMLIKEVQSLRSRVAELENV